MPELEIVNVVATADFRQQVDLVEISQLPHTTFDQGIYGERIAVRAAKLLVLISSLETRSCVTMSLSKLVENVPNDEDLPDGLSWDKITNRAFDISESKNGKIEFRIERHPTFGGRPVRRDNPSAARWHITTKYVYDPGSDDWEISEEKVDFDYDIDLLVDYAINSVNESGLYDEFLEEAKTDDKIVDDEITNYINYLNESRGNADYEIKNDVWESMLTEFNRVFKIKILHR